MKKILLSLILCFGAVQISNAQDNGNMLQSLSLVVRERNNVVQLPLPPNNEIWYTSVTNKIVELEKYPQKLVSNTYKNGVGKYKFAGPVVDVGNCFSDQGNPLEIIQQFSAIVLPASVIRVDNYFAMGKLQNVTDLVLPVSLISIGIDFVGGLGEYHHSKHIYFTSDSAPSNISWRAFWNQSSVLYIHYPVGADYSSIKRELDEWKREKPSFSYVMVSTQYIYK